MEELTTNIEESEDEKYKEDATSQPISTTDDNTKSKAPDGVPTVKSWEVRKDGGILGLIYGSPNADDGDYIETSPIVKGVIDNCSVVSTQSGSRYFLSPSPPDDVLDTLNAFRYELTSGFRQGTITLTKGGDDKKKSLSRSSFSLFNLFGDKNNKSETTSMNSSSSPPPQPLAPPTGKVPPIGTPTLTGCVFNDDGTITGYIFGSPTIGDGYLITTSPIVDGARKQFETVTTATGSLYFLG